MVDKVKLLCKERLNKELFTDDNTNVFKRIGTYTYKLFNEDKSHSLLIKESREGIIIEGSLRKWHFGKDSLNDMTPENIYEAINKLSSITLLSKESLLNGTLLTVEVGITFPISILPSTALKSIYSYSTLELGRYDTSISFRAKDYWLGLYDKEIEIARNKESKRKSKILQNALRIELKIFRRTAFDRNLRGINTLNDLIVNYRMLLVSLLVEIKRIEMKPIIIELANVSFKGKKTADFKNYLLYIGMNEIGIRETFKYLKELDIHSSSKSVQRNKIRAILDSYSKKSVYSKLHLLSEIKKHLAKKIAAPLPLPIV